MFHQRPHVLLPHYCMHTTLLFTPHYCVHHTAVYTTLLCSVHYTIQDVYTTLGDTPPGAREKKLSGVANDRQVPVGLGTCPGKPSSNQSTVFSFRDLVLFSSILGESELLSLQTQESGGGGGRSDLPPPRRSTNGV